MKASLTCLVWFVERTKKTFGIAAWTKDNKQSKLVAPAVSTAEYIMYADEYKYESAACYVGIDEGKVSLTVQKLSCKIC